MGLLWAAEGLAALFWHFMSFGYQGFQPASVLGHAAHFLESASRLLDCTFRHPIQLCASASSIHCSYNDRSLPLHCMRWRSGRDNFEQVVKLLGKNVAQIQEDSGFLFPRLEQVLMSIYNWMKSV
ncbi:hypothetical protein RB195_023628 [Necator americanus]|uniref:Uncharacterized protein n=1 Tax=Necator americanus TaxID=51031 RepID=A0ABR1EM71_NECAM